jgi:hypothetical protein
LSQPESYVSAVLRNFGEASVALGSAVDRLVLRLAAPKGRGDPDYQIQTVDGEDATAFSGKTHDFMHKDITITIEEEQLQDRMFSAEEVKDWLNAINGEGAAGGAMNPILTDRWKEEDVSDPRE